MINNTNNDNNNYAIGAGAGYLSYHGTKKLGGQFKKGYASEIMRQMKDFSTAESKALKKAVYDGFVQSGLKSKKYYLHNVTPENYEQMTKLFERKSYAFGTNSKFCKIIKKLNGNRKPLTEKQKEELAKKLTEHLKNREYRKFFEEIKNAGKVQPSESVATDSGKAMGEATINSAKNKIIKSDKHQKISSKLKIVADGKNAFCSPLTRDIMINTDKLGSAAFHEMGHALNASGSKAMKTLVIGRHISSKFVPVILAIGLLKSKKKDSEKPEGILDKTTTFIKNNAGKLAFASLVPMLTEEGLASIRGAKIAKKVLDPKLLKSVNKYNFLAWTTYFAGALITSGAVTLAVKIRDKIAEK